MTTYIHTRMHHHSQRSSLSCNLTEGTDSPEQTLRTQGTRQQVVPESTKGSGPSSCTTECLLTDAVGIDISLFLATTSGPNQNECCVSGSLSGLLFSYRNLHGASNSVTEIPKVGVQLPEWRVTLHLSVSQS